MMREQLNSRKEMTRIGGMRGIMDREELLDNFKKFESNPRTIKAMELSKSLLKFLTLDGMPDEADENLTQAVDKISWCVVKSIDTVGQFESYKCRSQILNSRNHMLKNKQNIQSIIDDKATDALLKYFSEFYCKCDEFIEYLDSINVAAGKIQKEIIDGKISDEDAVVIDIINELA